MFLFVLKSILSRFPAPCLNFQEKWRDTCVILKLQGQPKKNQKNKLPVKTGLCHVLSWLFRFVISDICLAQKIFRSGHFSAYTRQIVKICINQKNLLRNTVNMLRFQNDILSFGPALYIYIFIYTSFHCHLSRSKYTHTYIHTLHYITLHYITLDYITLH